MTTDPTWRTSSYSGGQGNCIEVGNLGSRVLVRDTQNRAGPVLQFTPGAWSRFADRLKAQRPLGGCARKGTPPPGWAVTSNAGRVRLYLLR